MEDFTKTLNNLGQDAIKSAKRLKNIASLNIEIATEEGKRNANFTTLGQLYYDSHGDQPEDELSEVCELIRESDDKINSLREKLYTLKGMAQCENCHADIKANSAYCPYCGTPTNFKQQSGKQKSDLVCPNCGEKYQSGMSYCAKCGTKLQ